jgi:hypothetical protein
VNVIHSYFFPSGTVRILNKKGKLTPNHDDIGNHFPFICSLTTSPSISWMIHSLIDRLIVLTGLALQPEHCHVTNINGVVAITPLTDARVFINGTLIREATQVKHDDRVSGHLHDTDSVLSLSLSLSLSSLSLHNIG